MKKTWDIIKYAINKKKNTQVQDQFRLSNGEVTSDKAVISEHLNNFFTRVDPQLVAKSGKQSKTPNSYLKIKPINSIMLAPVTCEEVTKLISYQGIMTLDTMKLKARLLQAVNSVISTLLSYIFNSSIMNGVVSDILKTANIIPLLKKDDFMFK